MNIIWWQKKTFMNSSFIDKILHRKFESHKYQLSNNYIYREESDFFSITTSGYAQEIEIKVSRSDFKADFKKSKHDSFRQIFSGQKYIVERGQVTYKVKEPIMMNFVGEDGRGVYEEISGRKKVKRVPSGKFYEYITIGEPSKNSESQAISTAIRIFKPVLPNKFWFAVPENLISIDEIPDYAGLFYITESGKLKIIKNAPFIHKEKHDLTSVLLDKFYYFSQKLKRELQHTRKSW